MITLFGAMIGFLSSMFPHVMELLKDRRDKTHEIEVLKIQMRGRREEQSDRLEEIRVQADASEMQALYASVRPSGVWWVDALSGTVRPVITYGFFLAYVCVKLAQYHVMMNAAPLPWLEGAAVSQNWFDIIERLWNAEDQAIFASIIAFWFGSRQFSRRGEPR